MAGCVSPSELIETPAGMQEIYNYRILNMLRTHRHRLARFLTSYYMSETQVHKSSYVHMMSENEGAEGQPQTNQACRALWLCIIPKLVDHKYIFEVCSFLLPYSIQSSAWFCLIINNDLFAMQCWNLELNIRRCLLRKLANP